MIRAKLRVRAMIEAAYWDTRECIEGSECYDPCADVEVILTESTERMTEIER